MMTLARVWARLQQPLLREVVRLERQRIQREVDRVMDEVKRSRIPPTAKADALLALLAVRARIEEADTDG